MCLDDAGISLDSIPGLEQLFTDDHPISNPFQHVSTKHKQEAYFKVNFGLVVSSPCVIATGISLGFSFSIRLHKRHCCETLDINGVVELVTKVSGKV